MTPDVPIDLRISLRRLEIFIFVVELGGVTRAAEKLLVAQPAVSAQLRSLQDSIGAPLFHRSGSAMVLSEAGDRTYRWAKEVLASGAQLQRGVRELATGAAGTAVMTASMAIGTYLLPPILIGLRAERPGTMFTLRIDQPQGALRSAQVGDSDFAVLTWVGDEVPEGLAVERLWDEPVVLCASPAGPPHADVVEPRELESFAAVASPPEVALQLAVGRQLRAVGGELRPVIHLGHAEAMKRAVVELGGVALLPRYAVTRELDRGELRVVRIAGVELTESIGLYRRENSHPTPLQLDTMQAIRRGGPTGVSATGPAVGLTRRA